MFRLSILFLLFIALGCENPEVNQRRKEQHAATMERAKAEEEKAEVERQAKYEKLKTSKILNVRVNQDSIDFVLEDGTILTIFAYATKVNNDYQGRLRIK